MGTKGSLCRYSPGLSTTRYPLRCNDFQLLKGAQWLSGRVLDSSLTEGPRVGVSPASLRCVFEQEHYSSLSTGSTQEYPCLCD